VNPTAEALFAALGAITAVAVPITLFMALVNRIGRVTSMSAADRAKLAREYPKARSHEPGGCWCGELHESTAASDGTPAWRAS
jgi:hypothetical protein